MNILSVDYSFWLYKSKVNKRGEVPVYMRIAVGDSKKEIATGIYIKERDWNASRRVIRRSSADYEIENLKLEVLVKRFKEVVKMLVENEHDFTADLIKQRMLNENKQVKGLLPYFEGYLEKMKSLVGIEFAANTYKRYRTTFRHLKKFISEKLKGEDILLRNIDKKFLLDFGTYLKVEKKNSINSSARVMKNVSTVVNAAVIEGFLEYNPFIGLKIKQTETQTEFLNATELKKVEDKRFSIDRLENVRKVWLFMVYTGLAYCDALRLTKSNIAIEGGVHWLITSRAKTKTEVKVPLIEKAVAILNEFLPMGGKTIFSMISNQRMNQYLKEIGDACEIDKNLECHMARRTFASTICLSNGVGVESLQKMMGHKKITTTMIYAKVIDEKLITEMKKVG